MSREAWGDDGGDAADNTDHLIEAGWWDPDTAAETLLILKAILAADERGQGAPFAEAMDRAKRFVEENGP